MSQYSSAPKQRSREQWHSVLRSRNITPARSMGQNFLVEPDVVRSIVDVAGIEAGDRVVEVGPGLGILTRELLGRAAHVFAIELDRDLVTFLERDFAGVENLTLIERDARHVELESIVGGGEYHVVANLPYSTGTVIIRRFLELDRAPKTMTVMVQREVAERMIATAPDVSLLSIATQLFAEAEVSFTVPPDAFLPPPKVESAVVRMVLRDTPMASPVEIETLFRLATMAFQRKRKTMSNGLSQGLGVSKPEAEAMLERAGIVASLRPQAVPLDAWISLARVAST
ncbi:MAG: 16S rRNA (adenine(1518)-N(6)/adenine(1519)-N(6))-dimethyltransferase RsmA [Chloroflexota bacterium]|nr:16S rRNA (adenine(1518)-N(6)/adenine(1519)-N(6))-dimethyltransferase RsmA [Chloroflexota bacterium]